MGSASLQGNGSMSSPPNVKTQSASILRLLIEAHGAWVPLPQIIDCAAQYNARVFELRRSGFDIENRTECVEVVPTRQLANITRATTKA